MILKLHRANIDIQWITDPYACCVYVVDYINKSDKGMSDQLCEVLKNNVNNNSSTRKILQDLSSTFHNLSEVSAQEAAYNILQLRMCESSVKTTFISSVPPDRRHRIMKSKENLEKLDGNSNDIFETGDVEYYSARPPSLFDLNFAQFVAWFEYSKKKSNNSAVRDDEEVVENEEEDPDTDRNNKYIKLENNLGFVRQRKKPKVIKYHRQSIDTDPDLYFYGLVMLYFPWKDQKTDLDEKDCAKIFEEHRDFILENRQEFNAFDDNSITEFLRAAELNAAVHEDEDDDENENQSDNENEGGIIRGNRNRVVDVNAYTQYSLPSDNNTNLQFDMDGYIDEVNNDLRNATVGVDRYTRPDKLNDSEYQALLSVLNSEQRDFLTHVIDSARHRNQDQNQMSYFVTGGAGVGKSLLIKAIYQSFIRLYDVNRDRDLASPSVLLCAPTGKAAYNIGGQTLHSAFHLPLNQSNLNELSADVAHSMSVALSDLKVVIIDEISMVSAKTFLFIDERLRDIFDQSKIFGGRHIILFGDFWQLPPVHGSPIYSPSKNDITKQLRAEALWSKFKVHYLTEIMRQRDDALFAVALNNMAKGTMTEADIALFQSRTFRSLPPEAVSTEGQGLVRLFWQNVAVENCNTVILNGMSTERSESRCFDQLVGSGSRLARESLRRSMENCTLPANKTMGLAKLLDLRLEARYMITSNLDTSDGLINGTTGILKQVDFGTLTESSTGSRNITKPLRLWFLLDDSKSGQKKRAGYDLCNAEDSIYREWTPIEPISAIIKKRSNGPLSIKRIQFPVVVAEAITIHKSQGSTYSKIALEVIGNKSLSRSLMYVACSRATSASGLFIISDKFKKTKAPKPTDPISIEMSRHESVKLVPTFKHLRDNRTSIQLIFHNVQSLRLHMNQLVNDQAYTNSDVLLFAETWSTQTQNLSIQNFTEVARCDVEGNRAKPYGSISYINNSSNLGEIRCTLSRNYSDGNGHHLSCSAFVVSNTLFASIYISPQFSTRRVLEVLEEILSMEYDQKIICGDFNCDFKQQSNENSITHLFQRFGLQSALPSSIASTTNTGTYIDNIFSNVQVLDSSRYISFSSYHDPLYLRFNL